MSGNEKIGNGPGDKANTQPNTCKCRYLWFRGSCLLCPVSDILDPHADDVGVGWLVHLTLGSGVTLQHGPEKMKVILHCRQLHNTYVHVDRMYSCKSGGKGEGEREMGRESELILIATAQVQCVHNNTNNHLILHMCKLTSHYTTQTLILAPISNYKVRCPAS